MALAAAVVECSPSQMWLLSLHLRDLQQQQCISCTGSLVKVNAVLGASMKVPHAHKACSYKVYAEDWSLQLPQSTDPMLYTC
jgi:hypothetical protein